MNHPPQCLALPLHLVLWGVVSARHTPDKPLAWRRGPVRACAGAAEMRGAGFAAPCPRAAVAVCWDMDMMAFPFPFACVPCVWLCRGL